MQWFAHKSMRRIARPLVFVFALLSLVFLLQVTPHGHANRQHEAACTLCQVAHVGVTPAISHIVLSDPLELRVPDLADLVASGVCPPACRSCST